MSESVSQTYRLCIHRIDESRQRWTNLNTDRASNIISECRDSQGKRLLGEFIYTELSRDGT